MGKKKTKQEKAKLNKMKAVQGKPKQINWDDLKNWNINDVGKNVIPTELFLGKGFRIEDLGNGKKKYYFDSGSVPVILDFNKPIPYRLSIEEKDKAMLNNKKREGGINFNADKMNLAIQNNGGAIKFELDPAMLRRLQNSPGFSPVIINIQPLKDPMAFLGAG